MKRKKYSDGVIANKTAKLSSVKKTLLIGLWPKVQENYDNVKTLLSTVDLSKLPCPVTFSCDIKLDLFLVGKQQGSCKHPYIYCTGSDPWTCPTRLLTIGDLKKFQSDYLLAKAADEKTEAMDYNNCIYDNLLQHQFPDDKLILDCIAVPELHILLGVITKLLQYIQACFGKDAAAKLRGEEFVRKFLTSLNITVKGRGQLEGNAAAKVAKNSSKLQDLAKELSEDVSEKVCRVGPVLEAFNEVKHLCFGERILGNYPAAIQKFSGLWRSLPSISIPPKAHMLETHVVQFLDRRRSEGFVFHGLAYWGEQGFEQTHHDFKVHWSRRAVGEDHEKYVDKLKDALVAYNTSHI